MTEANALPEPAEAPLLVFTDSAALKVSELIREEGNPNAQTTCGCGSSFST